MRKEYRVGLGIGGVLLAVVGLAVVVRSHTHNTPAVAKAPADKPDGTEGDPNTPAADAAPPAPSPLPGELGVSPSGSAPEQTKPEPFDKSEADRGLVTPTPGNGRYAEIDAAFSSGPGPGPDHSMTPFPGRPTPGDSHAGVESSGSSDPHPYTPGTLPQPGLSAVPHGTQSLPVAGRTHKVAQGENFYTIARTEMGDGKYFLQIIKANPSINPQTLKIGQTIVIPSVTGGTTGADHSSRRVGRSAPAGGETALVDSKTQYTVKSGDSLYRIAMRLYDSPSKVDAIYELNKDRIGPDRSRLKLNMVLRLPAAPAIASR